MNSTKPIESGLIDDGFRFAQPYEPHQTARNHRTSRQASLVGAGIVDDPVCDQAVPYEQDDQRTNNRSDEAGTLVGTVPADQLAEPGRKERAGHSEHRGE